MNRSDIIKDRWLENGRKTVKNIHAVQLSSTTPHVKLTEMISLRGESPEGSKHPIPGHVSENPYRLWYSTEFALLRCP